MNGVSKFQLSEIKAVGTPRRIAIIDADSGFIWYVTTISGEDVREALVIMVEDRDNPHSDFDDTQEWHLEHFYSSGLAKGADYWLTDITGIDEIPDDPDSQDQDIIDRIDALPKSRQLDGYCHDYERE